MKRLKNGTFALYLDAMADGLWPANETKDPTAPVCVGDNVSSLELMTPVLRPCGAGEDPSKGHNCLCSRASPKCDARSSVYVASTEKFPDGPWRIAALSVTGAGWAPFNATLKSIGTSNPSAVHLRDGRTLLSIRSHAGYWPEIVSKVTHRAEGEHMGFALSDSLEGPFTISGNLSWQYGNDECVLLPATHACLSSFSYATTVAS